MFKYLIIGAIIVIGVIWLARRFRGGGVRRGDPKRERPMIADGGATAAEIDGEELDIDEHVMNEVRGLIAKGDLIEATKRIRDATGLGLEEAKDVVDSLSRTGHATARRETSQYGDEAKTKIDPAVLDDVRAILADGGKIEAIKHLRISTGIDLATAKVIVDKMEESDDEP